MFVKAQRIPLKYSMAIMLGSLFFFIVGPIPWSDSKNLIDYMLLMLLLLYFISFAFGYYTKMMRGDCLKCEEKILYNEDKILKMLNYTLYINLIITILLALIYTNTTSVSALMNKMINGLLAPSEAYYSKDTSSRAGSIVVWLSLIYSPWLNITKVLGIFYFEKLKLHQQVVYIFSLVVEVMRWLAVGTNKGLFDIVILFVFYYMILKIKYHTADSDNKIRLHNKLFVLLILVVGVIIAFFTFFSIAISSRVGGIYHQNYFSSFPYNQLPVGVRFFVEKLDSYLTQGYKNFIIMIKKCEFRWTFGVGNSRFLMQIVNGIFGIDLTLRTYPYQLAAFGIDPLASWHSAYGWFASDLSIFGIIPFVFLVGRYTCDLVKDTICQEDPVSITLLYMVFLAIVNASCTNYILAYSGSFIPFIVLVILRFCRKHNIVIGNYRL